MMKTANRLPGCTRHIATISRRARSWPGPSCSRAVSALQATKTHYEMLGVSEDASQADIKRAFRRVARQLHPDVNPDPDASARFMAALNAYQELSDSSSRSSYDEEIGTDTARASNPRFARFERWRAQVVPLVQAQLDDWTIEVTQIVEQWQASLTRQDLACQEAIDAARAMILNDVTHKPFQAAYTTTSATQEPRHSEYNDHHQQAYEGVFGSTEAPPQHAAQQQATRDSKVSGGAVKHGNSGHAAPLPPVVEDMLSQIQHMQTGVEDGSARMKLYMENRYEQVCIMFPGYPELVWEKEWYATSDGWIDAMELAMNTWKDRSRLRQQQAEEVLAALKQQQSTTVPMQVQA